jgi:hypothetical protein
MQFFNHPPKKICSADDHPAVDQVRRESRLAPLDLVFQHVPNSAMTKQADYQMALANRPRDLALDAQ